MLYGKRSRTLKPVNKRLDFWMLYGKRSSTLNAAKYYIFDRGIMKRLSTLHAVKD